MLYRATPHSSTKISPFEAMTGRKMRFELPEHPATIPKGHETLHSRLKANDSTSKLKMKDYADEKHHTKPSTLTPGDHVLVKQPKTNKLSTPFNPSPLTITQTKGSMITATNGSRRVVRNSSFFGRVPDSVPIKAEEEDEEEEDKVTLHSKHTPLLQRSPCAPPFRSLLAHWCPSGLRANPSLGLLPCQCYRHQRLQFQPVLHRLTSMTVQYQQFSDLSVLRKYRVFSVTMSQINCGEQ